MNKKISRRTFLKKSSKLALGTIFTAIIGHTYSKFIEPNWVELNRFKVQHPLISPNLNGFKIVQFSDTHLGFQTDIKDLQKITDLIMKESPDLIIFSGDLVDNLLSFIDIKETILTLSLLSASSGKYAVYGNHDHGGWGSEKYQDILTASGFSILKNEAVIINPEAEKNQFVLAGIDDAMLGNPDIEMALEGINTELYTILISHAPDTADHSALHPVNLQLSGHTHGGQVQLPFIGPLITPPFGSRYVEGLYQVSDNLTLYVNRGLGTTRLPYRFLSRPEISIFSLQNNNERKVVTL